MKRYKLFFYMAGSFWAGYLYFYIFKYLEILSLLQRL